MTTLIATRGLPGSGKSTWAYAQQRDDNDVVLVSRDDIRVMMFGKWTGKSADEELVARTHTALIRASLGQGRDVIVHDTNLRRRYLRALAKLAAEADAEFVVQDFTHVPLEDCIARNAAREAPIPEEKIREMHDRFLTKPISMDFSSDMQKVPSVEPYVPVPGTPMAVIVDIDGTVADHRSVRDPYDTSKYELDKVNDAVWEVIRDLVFDDQGQWLTILFTTGRHEAHRAVTEEWLKKNLRLWDTDEYELIMRQDPDRRDDLEKLDMFNNHIRNRYTVVSAWDDRDRVVQMWRALGIQTFQVANGDF